MNKKSLVIFLSSLFLHTILNAQEWTLKLRSSVELRTFRLTNKVDISEEKLAGATITLSKGAITITQMQSDGSGDFVIDVPANGDYILTISYSGCNPKKFAISTMNVPEELAKDNYKPTFGIEGVIMAKAFPSINYSVLQQALARIVYTPNGKKFDDEEGYTNQMLAELTKIREAENVLMNNFTSTNNTGDVALSKGAAAKATKAESEKAQKDKLAKEKLEADKIAKEASTKAAKEAAEKVTQSKVTKTKETPKEPVKEKTTTPAKETTREIVPSSTSSSEPSSAGVGSGDAKYSIPQALGADKYKATIKRADELFKMKRYSEAKPIYEEALKQKPNDPAATNKLAEIEKLTIKK